MRMLIVGAGATGGYFGGRLAAAGRDVTFLVRPKRAAALRDHGLHIVSPHGDLTLQPQTVTADTLDRSFDAILLTVKAFALHEAMNDLAPAIGAGTMILPVLNGMEHMDRLAARFGTHVVIGCACQIAAKLDDQGRIIQLAPFPQNIAYGEMDGAKTARIDALDSFMRGAGFEARLSPVIAREMWEKWILLATLGGVNCLMRGAIGEIVAAPCGVEFILNFLAEVVSVVRAVGVAPSEPFLASAKTMLTAPASTVSSSMYRDLLQGLPIEADQIIGDLQSRGEAAGLRTPFIEAAYANLMVYQRRLSLAHA